jgi:hypothetical protein
MNCQVARVLLPFARPNAADLDAVERQLLDAHLATCNPCSELARQECAWDERIGPAVRNVPIPEGLKDRLLARVAQECKPAHRLRRRVYAIATAAALFAAFGLVWYFVNQNAPLVDLSEQVPISTTDPDFVLDQLRADGKSPNLEFPQELYLWDFNLLTDYYVRLLSDGQRIPTLIFHKGDTEAKVTLWRRGKINTSRINESEFIRLLGVDGDDEYIGKVEIRGGKYKYRDFVKPGGKNTL